MPKNIVICCDGTSNEYAKNLTNVVKLFATLVQDARQVAFYHPGLGTMEPPGALTPWARRLTRLLGLAFGAGLEDDIRNAYVFLMDTYEPGDRVFLFGFSRGAYTARAVASLLRMYGLIRKGNETLVPYAIRMLFTKPHGARARRDARYDIFALAEGFKATFSSGECQPHLVGVWDTVASVGWIENPLHLPYTQNNSEIAHGRHAVAIDERRAFFRSNLWIVPPPPPPPQPARPSGPRDLKQVWFPGTHCDVGGGFPKEKTALSNNALKWMIAEATALGLLVDPDKVAQALGSAPPLGPGAGPHESLTRFWWLAEVVPKRHYNWATGRWERRMNLGRRRTMPPGSLVHRSAWDLGPEYSSRLPVGVERVD